MKKGFTLIEVITSVVVIAIVMIPVTLISMEYVRSAAYADSLTMATNLVRMEMAVVNNLNYSNPTLADGYDNTSANYSGYKYDLRRTVNFVPGTANNVKSVRIRVYPNGSAEQLMETATYVMDIQYGMGSAGGTAGDEAVSFLASGGTLTRSALSGVVLQNTRLTGNITVTGVVITPTINKTISGITMGGESHLSTSVSLPANTATTVNFTKNFFMNSNILYSGADGGTFSFNSTNVTHTITIQFIFYDGTQSAPYSWTYVK